MNLILFLLGLGLQKSQWHQSWRLHQLVEVLLYLALEILLDLFGGILYGLDNLAVLSYIRLRCTIGFDHRDLMGDFVQHVSAFCQGESGD